MKATGIVRKVDELGRIVLPKELRDTLDIKVKDPIEIFVDQDSIVLKKYMSSKACHITGEVSDDNLSLANGKIIISRTAAKGLVDEISQYLASY